MTFAEFLRLLMPEFCGKSNTEEITMQNYTYNIYEARRYHFRFNPLHTLKCGIIVDENTLLALMNMGYHLDDLFAED